MKMKGKEMKEGESEGMRKRRTVRTRREEQGGEQGK